MQGAGPLCLKSMARLQVTSPLLLSGVLTTCVVQEDVVLPFVGPTAVQPSSPAQPRPPQTSSLHVKVGAAHLKLPGTPPSAAMESSRMQVAFLGSDKTESIGSPSNHA